MATEPKFTILLLGNSLASYMCAAKLAAVLPEDIKLTFVETSTSNGSDIFYGNVTSPSTYTFLLDIGIGEPDLFPRTNTTFSLGTRYENWGNDTQSWTQSFHHPLPVFNGVEFHHYLTRLRRSNPDLADLEPYIMSVQAANNGVFAHPPEAKKTPLADMNYGYHFSPEKWRVLLSDHISASRITRIKADIESVQRDGDEISSITMLNGDVLKADFFIDATGSVSGGLNDQRAAWVGTRHLKAISTFNPGTTQGNTCRVVKGTKYGWQSHTSLQDGTIRLTVYAPEEDSSTVPEDEETNKSSIEVKIGHLQTPWNGNCLTLGHGASVVEPLTPAPIMLLQRDIERLAELLPVSNDMTVEKREYNRRFRDDHVNANLFSGAFFRSNIHDDGPYWRAAKAAASHPKLNEKITQFKSRGALVQYDYEPFNKEDWVMLYLGLRQYPKRYDQLADRVADAPLTAKLSQMRSAVSTMAKKMPPHEIYMAKLLKYLEAQHG